MNENAYMKKAKELLRLSRVGNSHATAVIRETCIRFCGDCDKADLERVMEFLIECRQEAER